MESDPHKSVREKVRAIFTELTGERATRLEGAKFSSNIASAITAALSGPGADEQTILNKDEIAFHLTD